MKQLAYLFSLLLLGGSFAACQTKPAEPETTPEQYLDSLRALFNAQEYEEAFALADSLSLSGMEKATIFQATLFARGLGCEQRCDTAVALCERGMADSVPEAFTVLGVMNVLGIYNAPDTARAFELFRTAVEMGEPMAMLNLGLMYENGFYVEQDYAEARAYYEKAAGLDRAEGYYSLGNLALLGRGMEPDTALAKDYFDKALELDEHAPRPNIELARLYLSGKFLPKDTAKAKLCLEIALARSSEEEEIAEAQALLNSLNAEE